MGSISYFRNTLNNEIIRLECLCEKWQENFLNCTFPEEESGGILQVIGQTKLLLKEKFKQFHDLIEMCEKNDPTQQKVTIEDLQGYWDMVTIEIDKINRDYNVLEQKESNEWKSISQTANGASSKLMSSDPEIPDFNINEILANAINDKKDIL